MEQLIKVDGLKLILSSQTTPVNQAAATVAEKYKVYYQAVISWSDWMEKEKYSWVSNMFFTPAIAAAVPFDMVKTMPANEAPKKCGMFTEDNADGQGLAGGVAGDRQGHGLRVRPYGRPPRRAARTTPPPSSSSRMRGSTVFSRSARRPTPSPSSSR